MKDENAEVVLSEISDEELDAKLVALEANIESTVNELIGNVIGSSMAKKAKTGDLFKDNRNMIGGLIGIGIAAGLELISPTGSLKSAAASVIVGGGVLYVASPYINAVPQSTGLAAATAGVTAYVGMVAGRITADYFPGNLSKED